MVIFLTLPEGTGHIDAFYSRYGARARRRVAEITYHELLRRGRAPGAAYVFTDRERMNLPQRRIAANIWDQLLAGGAAFRTYNHPLKQLGRFELLRKLYDMGVNRYNVYRLAELPTKVRFPVFIRAENDHNGPRTALVHTRAELDQETDRLLLHGLEPENLLVIEFEDTSDESGFFHKRGVLLAGDETVANHIYTSKSWIGKSETANETLAQREASDEFFRNNPDAELVMPFFELAGIQYGRIDYCISGGAIQVWEINDNPSYGGGSRAYKDLRCGAWMAAIESLAEGLPTGHGISIAIDPPDLLEALKH
jgi:hypothetical protein